MGGDHNAADRCNPTVKNIRTITVDLDDTLWEILPVIKRAEESLYGWLGENYPRITEMFTIEDMRILRDDIFNRFPDKLHDLTFLRYTVLTEAASAAGYATFEVDEAFAEALVFFAFGAGRGAPCFAFRALLRGASLAPSSSCPKPMRRASGSSAES